MWTYIFATRQDFSFLVYVEASSLHVWLAVLFRWKASSDDGGNLRQLNFWSPPPFFQVFVNKFGKGGK